MIYDRKSNVIDTEMLFCDAITANDKYIWFIAVSQNILFKIERWTGNVIPCGRIPNSKRTAIAYRSLFEFEEKLFLFPYEELNICIYDIQADEFNYVELDKRYSNEFESWKFIGSIRVGDELILYGVNPIIVILNIINKKIEYIDLRERLPQSINAKFWFWNAPFVLKNELHFVMLIMPYIIKIKIDDRIVTYKKIPEDEKKICIDNPIFYNDCLWYINRDNKDKVMLSKYNMNLEEVECYAMNIKKESSYRAFSYVGNINGKLWMIPGTCNQGIVYNLMENTEKKIDNLPMVDIEKLDMVFPHEFNYRTACLTEDGHIITIHAWSRQMVDIDTKDGTILTHLLNKVDSELWAKLFNDIFKKECAKHYYEQVSGMLESYINNNTEVIKSEKTHSKKYIGGEIYDLL